VQHDGLSVLMPVYNREKFVVSAIESILQQTYRHFRLIVYDDGSTDSTLRVVRGFCRRDSRVLLVRNEVNRGVAFARNRLLEAAGRGAACWQDSDDISNIYRLERVVPVFDQYAPRSVWSHALFLTPKLKGHWRKKPATSKKGDSIIRASLLFSVNHAPVFDERLTLGGEDVEWNKILEARVGKPILVRKYLYYVRRHPDRISEYKRLPENAAAVRQQNIIRGHAVEVKP